MAIPTSPTLRSDTMPTLTRLRLLAALLTTLAAAEAAAGEGK